MNQFEHLHQLNDTIRDHLLAQMCQAKHHHDNQCRYRTDDGKKCAVGALIKDEFYAPDFEGEVVNDTPHIVLAVANSVQYQGDIDLLEYLLSEWQFYHDGNYGRWLTTECQKGRAPAEIHLHLKEWILGQEQRAEIA